MSHRALITGVSGFVGPFLADHLLDCGDEVLGASPDGTWPDRSPETVRPKVELIAWDISRPDGLSQACRRTIERFRPQVVYHLAAVSVPADCGEDQPTPQAVAVNVYGTQRVLEAAAALVSPPRVLLVSTSHVYALVGESSARVDEHSPLAPRQGYGLTKLAAETVVRRAVASGLDALIVRAFQHTGPGQLPPMMLPEWAVQFARGGSEPVRVRTLDAWIDLSDVRDVVRAYRLLAVEGKRGAAYNVGSGQCRRSGEIFELLRRAAGVDRAVIELRPGRKQDPIADITRLVQRTGWQPRVPLEQTVADTLAWWQGGPSPSPSGREGQASHG
jgi:GDP-4-dehydro-6-deoxy-D-mannose reductase